jgi:hypothetical protein
MTMSAQTLILPLTQQLCNERRKHFLFLFEHELRHDVRTRAAHRSIGLEGGVQDRRHWRLISFDTRSLNSSLVYRNGLQHPSVTFLKQTWFTAQLIPLHRMALTAQPSTLHPQYASLYACLTTLLYALVRLPLLQQLLDALTKHEDCSLQVSLHRLAILVMHCSTDLHSTRHPLSRLNLFRTRVWYCFVGFCFVQHCWIVLRKHWVVVLRQVVVGHDRTIRRAHLVARKQLGAQYVPLYASVTRAM